MFGFAVLREIQIKITTKYHYTSIRFAKIQETKNKQTNHILAIQGPAKVRNNRLNFQIILVGIQDGRMKKTRALSIMSEILLPKHFLEAFSLSA